MPQEWKVGLVIPVHKPDKPVNEMTSYRPITMVSCIPKLMESLVGRRLQWEIERNRYLSATQCGFRSNRSSGEQVLCLENYISRAYNEKAVALAVFIDLKGAFDCVWHNALLYKLSIMGFKGRMLGWLHSYLSSHTFKVLFEGEESVEKNIHLVYHKLGCSAH